MKQKKSNRRWRLLADVRLQGSLCVRVIVYWMVCQITLVGTIATFNFLTDGEGSLIKFCTSGLVVSGLFLPFVLYDMVSFSNRMVGPMVNLRGRLRKFSETGTMERIQTRSGDYYQDVFAALNELKFKKVDTASVDPVGPVGPDDSIEIERDFVETSV